MKPFRERVLSQIDMTDPEACWVWPGTKSRGYGTASYQGKGYRIHRVVYEWLVGPISDGLVIDHLCRNPPCCNPAHLEPVTQRENVLRGSGSGGVLGVRKTHCPKGHPYDAVDTEGHWGCLRCKAARNRSRRQRLKIEALGEAGAAEAAAAAVAHRAAIEIGRAHV